MKGHLVPYGIIYKKNFRWVKIITMYEAVIAVNSVHDREKAFTCITYLYLNCYKLRVP